MTQKILYLGLDPPPHLRHSGVIHYPVIRIVPRPLTDEAIQTGFRNLPEYSHLLFTSKSTVALFCDALPHFGWTPAVTEGKVIIAVGEATAARLEEQGIQVTLIPEEPTSEGIAKMLAQESLEDPYFFWPHSALSRSVLFNFLRPFRHAVCPLYDTVTQQPSSPPPLEQFGEIVFTSPSTVAGFRKIYGEIPKECRITSIGPITAKEARRGHAPYR